MKKHAFTLNPVTSGSAPKYPSKKATVALASGLGLLLGGCQVAMEENPDACTAGEVMCQSSDILVQCDRNAVEHVINCDDYCVAQYGPEWVSYGCNAALPENHCQCNYDILDGEIASCTPEELYCADTASITYCDVPEGETWGTPLTVTCTEYCRLTLGPDYSSYEGCNADNPENLCSCVYDVLDGGIAQCTPGELQCLDDGQLATCNADSSFDYVLCSDKCLADLGEGAISLSCDATDAEDPCTCIVPE